MDWIKTIGVGLFVALAMPAATAASAHWVEPPSRTRSADVDVKRERAEAKQAVVQELEALAGWCTKKKLYACREEVHKMMVHFEPGNEVAMRGMGYKKQRDGTWEADERRRAPKNYNKDAEKEFPGKRTALTQTYKDRMLALLDNKDIELQPQDRLAIIEDVLFADPDDPRVHAMRGEQKVGDSWVLIQTAEAEEHRGALKDMVRKAFGSVPESVETEANAKEAALGMKWKGVYSSSIGRSLSTGSKKEAERLLQAMWATREFFNDALGVEATLGPEMTVYTFDNKEQGMTFVQNYPGLDDEYRETLKFYDGTGLAGTDDFVHWGPEPARRLDGQVRHALAWLFAGSYHIYPKHGWIFEGFGLYMTRELVGTRLTWYVRPQADTGYVVSSEDAMFRKNLLDTRSNWMAEAHKMLQKDTRPKLQFLLGKDVNQLSMDDMLYSYVLAAYFLEAEAETLPGILTKIGKGASSVAALETELGIDLRAIDVRVRRWLAERQ